MIDQLSTIRTLPVIEIENADYAVPLAGALMEGGVSVFEYTLRTPAALDALRRAKKEYPKSTIGMGTVRNREQAFDAIDAGADFLVTPGISEGLLDIAERERISVLLGAATPADVMAIMDHGQTMMKFFPAEPAGGIAYIKALKGPFPDAMFCPTGGISKDRVDDYLALDNVICVGGSWVATKAMIADKDWTGITANAEIAARS